MDRDQLEDGYRVEISGWDISENFFVEKAALKWDQNSNKEVCLQNTLRTGSIVFIRLLQPLASENNYPIGYQVLSVGPRDARGLMLVELGQLHPRQSVRREYSRGVSEENKILVS